jgi:hypothetical protein
MTQAGAKLLILPVKLHNKKNTFPLQATLPLVLLAFSYFFWGREREECIVWVVRKREAAKNPPIPA